MRLSLGWRITQSFSVTPGGLTGWRSGVALIRRLHLRLLWLRRPGPYRGRNDASLMLPGRGLMAQAPDIRGKR
jgi:hypothetical protein